MFNSVSLYTGAGGLDIGFEAAGFEVQLAVEMDRDCCLTLEENCDWPITQAPIEDIPSKEILKGAKLHVGDLDLLIGGPPCQPFSKSGYWAQGDTKRLADPRARTLEEYMRCVSDLLPRVFVFENVHGIKYSGKEQGFEYLKSTTERINRKHGANYSFSWAILNAADYGVPQTRTRFFVVGRRDGDEFRFPPPTHALSQDHGSNYPLLPLKPFSTAWDAIGNIEPREDEDLRIQGKWADLIPSIPEGENYLWHTNRKGGKPLFGWRTRYWSFLLKLAKQRPSWTIQAQPGPSIGPFHWKNRRLSVDEMAKLQTFPIGYRFIGSRRSAQSQIGNAVPCLLAEVLARAVVEQCFGESIAAPLKHSVDRQSPVPPPESIRPVPEKYLHLEGDHPDHP